MRSSALLVVALLVVALGGAWFLFWGGGTPALDAPTVPTAKTPAPDSEVPEVHLGFVKFYLALGDVEKARYHLERALKLDSTNPDALGYAKLLMKGTS